MYACACAGVTCGVVEEVVAGGARTIEEIAARCGAGSGCGGCWPILVEVLMTSGEPHAHFGVHSAA